MKHVSIDKFLAGLIVALGSTVAAGWLLKIPNLVQITPNFVYMAFNTALFFILLGGLLLIPEKASFRRQSFYIISALITLFSALIFAQDLFEINLGLDELLMPQAWIPNYSATPGRMAPQTAVCFMLTGISLILIFSKSRWMNFCIPIMAIIIISIAILSFTGYWLNLEVMYSWYKYTRMAVHTAAGVMLLGCAIWILWYRTSGDSGIFLNREDRRISAIGVGILSIIGLSAGMISFTLLAKELETSTKQNFSAILGNNADLIRYMMKEAVATSSEITNHPLMNQFVEDYDKTGSPDAYQKVKKVLDNLRGYNDSAIIIYNIADKKLVENGTLIEKPELTMKLDDNNQLLWKNGAYLNSKFELKNNNRVIGTIIEERPLENLTEIFKKGENIGVTGELMVCSPISDDFVDCLPSRSHPAVFRNVPRKFEGQSKVMDLVLKGQYGFHIAPDYSGHKVIAVGTVIKPFPIGVVLKIDSKELYAPIRVRLDWMVGVIISLVIVGISLLRSQLVPLVRKVILSEQQTRINEERLHLATSGTSDGLWDWNLLTNHIYRSPRYIEMLGYTDEEFTSEFNTNSIIHPDDLVRVKKSSEEHFNKLAPYDIEVRLRHREGHYTWFNTRGQASWDENGKAVRMTGFVTDISHRKETERLKNEFVSIVSHELRTPLTSIRGSLGLLLSGVGGQFSDKIRNLIEIAYKNCERLVLLINDILDIEKIESGQMRFELEWLRIDKILEQAIELNQSYAEKLNVEFVSQRPLSAAEVNVDANRLLQVITNLLSNAAKFSNANSKVIISTEEMETTVKIMVTDQGSGIPKEFRGQIFGKFAQADSSAIRKKGGTGLGLNISKAIVEKFHGTINFISEQDKGSTFFFILPKASRSESIKVIVPSSKLLICEDDPDIAILLKNVLEQQNYSVDIARDAAEAADMLEQANYEGLVLDLMLPDKDGLTFIEELRNNEATKKLPIIVVSARAEESENKLNGRAIGVVDWLTKPYDEARLIKAVKRIHSFSGRPTILHVEDDPDIAKVISYGLAGIAKVLSAATLDEAKQHIANEHIDLILLDISLPDGSGLKLIDLVNGTPVIIFSAIEVSQSVSKKVEAALVKSRTSEEAIVATIKSILNLDKGNL